MTIEELFLKVRNDLVNYSAGCLKIVSNDGNLINFNLNEQQKIVHDKIETQLRETGKVRVIILKSRKLGMSTYTAARFIHKTTLNKHLRAGVITHVSDSTNALFRIYKRFYDNLPDFVKPTIKKNNSKELEFAIIDSSLKVSTAGSAETGRGDTLHCLHCSEFGFFPNADEIAAGIMRSIADVPGTEIIIESTATNIDTLFYSMWQSAVNGTNDYLPIFLPWTVDPSCSKSVPIGYQFTSEELDYARLYQLTDEQLYWRKITINQLGEKKFKNEYPITADEAFSGIDTDSFILPETVLEARKRTIDIDYNIPLIIGVDVASMGADKTCIVHRRGNNIPSYRLIEKMRNEEVADELIKIINRDKPTKVFIDGTGGYGGGVAAILRMRGYESEEIHFGGKATNNEYANKRAEMYGNLREWLQSEVSIPDEDIISSDLSSFGYKHNLQGQLLLESKADIKKRIKRSPDIGDAMALTFAYPLGPALMNTSNDWGKLRTRDSDYSW